MNESDEQGVDPTPAQATPDGTPTEPARDLRRAVSALVATVDQHSAEIDKLNVEQMILVFALGALAGVVFLQHRELRRLASGFAD